jgi:ferredoxin
VAAFFALPLVAATFFGRAFCGAVCPLGAVQDLALLRPRRVPAPVEHALGLLPYVYLGFAVLFAATGSAFVICKYDPFVALFRLSGPSGIVVTGAALLLIGTVIGRPYCRFLCPYGVLLRWAALLARWHVRITPAECVQCHLCADACPFGAIRPPTAALAPEDRTVSRQRFARLLALLPVLILAGALLGRLASPALARMHHTVVLTERVWREERGRAAGTTDDSQAFRNLGEPNELLYRRAIAVRRQFDAGSALLGGWLGLVAGGKLLFLAIRRTRPDYEADPAACLHCARCYRSCPVEHDRLAALAGTPRETTV